MKYKIITSTKLIDFLELHNVLPQFEVNEAAYFELTEQLSSLLEQYSIQYAFKNKFEN